ncbi:SGNH/GDSL hydrolase family protein [candidate division CSSED10-310 bacterium]|uniref:SGNH/GDSL hydrolase family protein n=1 Tax=candidate division CSSED10-310 bacterium TaxID=2855610 RepID=A0ABV6Z5T0_UNCC1
MKPGYQSQSININSHGFRGEEFPRDFERTRLILVLGESTTFGWFLNDPEAYPVQLMQELRHRGLEDVYVVNGGVPSYTSTQVYLYLKEIVESKILKPDLVLVNVLWNDICYSSVVNWYPEILVDRTPPPLMSFLIKKSKLFRYLFLKNPTAPERVDVFNKEPLNEYKKNLKQMIDVCQQHKIPLAFIQPPFDADHLPEAGLYEFHITYRKPFFINLATRYLKEMVKLASEYNIPVINHRVSFRHLHQYILFHDLFHPTPHGNSLIAKDIADYLQGSMQFGKQ